MSLVSGLRSGLRSVLRSGLNPSDGGGSSLIPGVTRDTASGWYFPANAGEWTALMAFAGLATGNPSSAHLCQEAAGPLADSIGAVTLTAVGAGHLFQQPVTGFTRLAATTVDGTVGQMFRNTTTAPNPSLVSTLYLAAIRMPAANPAAARDLMANQAVNDCRVSTLSKQTIISGASTTGAAILSGTVQWIALQHDVTASAFTGYNLAERIAGTFGAAGSNATFALGGLQASAADVGYLYSCIFNGAPAELTTAQMRTLYQTLTRDAVVPVVIPW